MAGMAEAKTRTQEGPFGTDGPQIGDVVSEGTLLTRDLIPAFLDAIRIQCGDEETARKYELEIPAAALREAGKGYQYEYHPFWESDAAYELLEVLIDQLGVYGPVGSYFGANEGDGACFGWWMCEEREPGDYYEDWHEDESRTSIVDDEPFSDQP